MNLIDISSYALSMVVFLSLLLLFVSSYAQQELLHYAELTQTSFVQVKFQSQQNFKATNKRMDLLNDSFDSQHQ